jgi:hypothetical protein
VVSDPVVLHTEGSRFNISARVERSKAEDTLLFRISKYLFEHLFVPHFEAGFGFEIHYLDASKELQTWLQ